MAAPQFVTKGWAVFAFPEQGGARPVKVSRTYHVESAAREFCALLLKSRPECEATVQAVQGVERGRKAA